MDLQEFQKAMKSARYHYARSEEVLREIDSGPRFEHFNCDCSKCRELRSWYTRLYKRHDRHIRRLREELRRALDATSEADVERRGKVFELAGAIPISIK